MNVFGKREKRGWRKARKRGVSPIIATILLVAITVVLAAVLYVLISSLTTGGANTVPIGTTFAYGTAQQTSSPPASTCATGTGVICYAIGIQSAGSSATTSNVHFSVQKSGSPITTQPKVYLTDASGGVLATWSGSAWDNSAVAFASTDTLILTGTTSTPGDSLVAQGVGALSGTTGVVLP